MSNVIMFPFLYLADIKCLSITPNGYNVSEECNIKRNILQ